MTISDEQLAADIYVRIITTATNMDNSTKQEREALFTRVAAYSLEMADAFITQKIKHYG